MAPLDFVGLGETRGRSATLARAAPFAAVGFDALDGLATVTEVLPPAFPDVFAAVFTAALLGNFPAALPADTLRAATALARAGAFPRPPTSFPPAGPPAADVRLGFARRFAFAMRSRYLLIERNVNGAAASRDHVTPRSASS